ncbi:MAG TPA: hypothetical protein VFU47_05180 [Armatimonadota bacterium]|nr:hypothetical protein [Armatimonadota bacterium]
MRPSRLPVALVCAAAVLLARAAASESRFVFVDLQPKANHRLNEELHKSAGNHLGNLPQGEYRFEDSRWKIGEMMLHLKSENVPEAPEKIDGLKVGARCDRLHFLHTCGYGEAPQFADGTEIGAYTVEYADGSAERIPIVYGEDVRDWWDWPDRTALKRAKVAWTGENPAATANQRKVRLFSVVWTNPHPEKEIATIEVNSAGTMCDPMVIAISAEQK